MARTFRIEAVSRWLALGLLLCSQLALAQNVLVLELKGDRRNRVRNQIVSALQDTGELQLVPIRSFQTAAKRARLRGARATNDRAIARLAPGLDIDMVVGGTVTKRGYVVRFIDSKGKQIYRRTLPLRKGVLTASNQKKLARAVVTAVNTLPSVMAAKPGGQSQEIVIPPDTSGGQAAETTPPPGETAPTEIAATPAEAPEEPEEPSEPRDPTSVGPTTITLHLGGITTWRNYCAHPGVGSCGEFNALPEAERPTGVSVLFNTPIPYAGFAVGLDLFPLANAGLEGLQGLGISGQYSRGFSLTEVNRRSDTGETEPERVVSIDQSWLVALAYRYYFGLGSDETGPLPAYVGGRVGYASRTFDVDPTATVGLTGSHRRYPQIGLDVSIPIIRQVRAEASAHYFIGPKAGQEELNDYGASVSSGGFGFEAGLAGEIWGPLGYELRFRMMSFKDRFEGEGARWAEGGAAEERYTSVSWGLTAGF